MLKLNSITGAALLLFGSVAFAQQVGDASTAGTGLTRAEVQAELARAIESGEIAAVREHAEGTAAMTSPRGAGAQGRAFAQPGLSRAEVKAELARAIQSGELAAWRERDREGTAVMTSTRAAGAQGRPFAEPGLTRAEVMAEFARARASGELDRYQALHGGGGN
jgi:uncharacterized protein YjiS (DUF1127 family)